MRTFMIICLFLPHVLVAELNLETAVQDGKSMESFESEGFPASAEHSQKVKAAEAGKPSDSKDSIDLPSRAAVSRLRTTIHLTPTRPLAGLEGKIIPATAVLLSATVKNLSEQESASGDIFIQFAFRPPHQTKAHSVLFQTEKIELGPIAPGNEVTVSFKTPQLLPTIFEYVRHDWAMRDYQAIIEIGNHKKITGTRALAFTGYYYEGPSMLHYD